jgi:tRNA(fMet)-specific endonuclease VapC
MSDADIRIAATALKHNLVMVTENVNHFRRIPGLSIENWRA